MFRKLLVGCAVVVVASAAISSTESSTGKDVKHKKHGTGVVKSLPKMDDADPPKAWVRVDFDGIHKLDHSMRTCATDDLDYVSSK